MGFLINWYDKNNELIIQVLIIVVGMMMIYWVYRLFFKVDAEQLIAKEPGIDTGAIEPKQNQAVVNESIKNEVTDAKVLDSSAQTDDNNSVNTTPDAEASAEKPARFNLKAADASSVVNAEDLKSKILDLEKRLEDKIKENVGLDEQIKKLQSKLDEYEIVAEDLSDLQELKIENAKLKESLELATPVAKASVQEASAEADTQTAETEEDIKTEAEPISEKMQSADDQQSIDDPKSAAEESNKETVISEESDKSDQKQGDKSEE